MQLRSVMSFEDPYQYLQHVYDYHKRHTPGFSYEAFSRRAGIASPNYLKLITERKKSITSDKLCAVSEALGHSLEEQSYFEDLVRYHQASTDQEGRYYRKKIERGRESREKVQYAKTAESAIIETWYAPILLLHLHDRAEGASLAELARALKIPERELDEKTQSFLERRIVILSDGKYQMGETYLLFEPKVVGSLKQKDFLKQSLQYSMAAFQERYAAHKFYSQFFTIRKENMARYLELIDQLIHEMTSVSDRDQGHDIFLLNVQYLEVFSPEREKAAP